MSTLQRARRPRSRVQAGQGGVIENMGGCVADFLHRQANSARFFVEALLAAPVRRLAHAGGQRQRTVQHANHLADRDVAGFPGEDVSASPALLAVQEAMTLQLEEDRLEEFSWKSLSLSKFRGLHGSVAGVAGQFEQRFETVLR